LQSFAADDRTRLSRSTSRTSATVADSRAACAAVVTGKPVVLVTAGRSAARAHAGPDDLPGVTRALLSSGELDAVLLTGHFGGSGGEAELRAA
jgi:hypothetical protein